MKEKYGVIYMIRNKINNKIYFGQTSEKNGIDRRYKNDIIKHTHNTHLKSSLIKHGIDNFEVVKEFDVAYSKEELDKLEVMYIKIYKTTDSNYGYNKKNGGANGKLSDETKLKLSIATKQLWKNKEYRKNMTAIMKEKWKDEEYRNTVMTKAFTPENREKLSKLCTKRFKGVPKSEEEKLKNSISTKASWTDERRKKASDRLKRMHQEQKVKEFHSNKMKSQWSNEKFRKTIAEKRTKKYVLIDVITGEHQIFIGRESLREHTGMSLSYINKYMSKELLHKDRYLFMPIEKFDINKNYKKDVL